MERSSSQLYVVGWDGIGLDGMGWDGWMVIIGRRESKRWSKNLILGMEPKFQIGPKLDKIGACARIAYITIYCFSRFLYF